MCALQLWLMPSQHFNRQPPLTPTNETNIMTTQPNEATAREIQDRLEYLRGEIQAERISYGELMELQSLVKHIKPGDVELLEWAGVKEKWGLPKS